MNIIIKSILIFLLLLTLFIPACSASKKKLKTPEKDPRDEALEMLEDIEFDEDLPEDTGR